MSLKFVTPFFYLPGSFAFTCFFSDPDFTMTNQELDELAINTIRTLSIDAVQQAKSGHRGMPTAKCEL